MYVYKFNVYALTLTQISAKTSELNRRHVELPETLKRRKKETDHCLDVQRFKREAEQAEQWIAMREQLLNSEDFGVSIYNNLYFDAFALSLKTFIINFRPLKLMTSYRKIMKIT